MNLSAWHIQMLQLLSRNLDNLKSSAKHFDIITNSIGISLLQYYMEYSCLFNLIAVRVKKSFNSLKNFDDEKRDSASPDIVVHMETYEHLWEL